MNRSSPSTAGKGDPYWYEWTVGLRKVVDMLSPQSGIESVTFQATGVKGWDDVVVRYLDGRGEFIQVKHSRKGKNITFGDLVTVEEDSSLLQSLFRAWLAHEESNENDRFVLLTNRASGERVSRTDAGVSRPPLITFWQWLRGQLNEATSLDECNVPPDWRESWSEWLGQLSDGTSEQQLEFLKSFDILTNQEDLPALEEAVLSQLQEVFQVPRAAATPLFQALTHALRSWTTSDETVTAEDAFTAMALSDDVASEHRAPPPPTPFFPSRTEMVETMERLLRAESGESIIFLSAEPGAGKTSLASQLENQRTTEPLRGTIGLRYYAFRPITPESALIPPDADYFVRPDRLWFSLLSQLRGGLVGKLREYQVPLRNGLLEWQAARAHVLRLAELIGNQLGRPLVILIDGIDHAARAMRYQGEEVRGFFSSLPGPDELNGKPIRLVIAGQPPQSYPEYPSWLRTPHQNVKVVRIGRLVEQDVLFLLRQKHTAIPNSEENECARIVNELTLGNTLAVVFAIQEAQTCNSTDELRQRLRDRHLQDGLQRYYEEIWNHALSQIATPVGMSVCMATALCLSNERLTGQLMSVAFGNIQLTADQWRMALASVTPLVVMDVDGFRVLHNDVRVFLHGLLTGQTAVARQIAASAFADYYKRPDSNRLAAHKTLRHLLANANREREWARVFTVEWILEAAALGIPYRDLSVDAVAALRYGAELREWPLMTKLACALEMLERWEDVEESKGSESSAASGGDAPQVLPTEMHVRPLSEWQLEDLATLAKEAGLLVGANQNDRASGLLHRWMDGLSATVICRCAKGLVANEGESREDERTLAPGGSQCFKSLGTSCRQSSISVRYGEPDSNPEHEAEFYFEKGWIEASCSHGPFDSLASCLQDRLPHYLSNFELAAELLSGREQWVLVKALLENFTPNYEQLSPACKAKASWWAVRSGLTSDQAKWLAPLSEAHYGLPPEGRESVDPALLVCRALGWKETASDPMSIARGVRPALRLENGLYAPKAHISLLLMVSALLGQLGSVKERRGLSVAADFLPLTQLKQVMTALWKRPHAEEEYQYGALRGRLALELVKLVLPFGEEHRANLTEVADTVSDVFPVDPRMDSLLEVYRFNGDRHKLRTWLMHWLAEDSELWIDASSRADIVRSLKPLAQELGEAEIIASAEEKLRWMRISYRSHKDYSFALPLAYLSELIKRDASCWREQGVRIWALSEACSKQGGDDRCSWELGEILGEAAFSCGPTDVYQLLTAQYPDRGTRSWFFPTASRIISGFGRILESGSGLTTSEKLICWCLSVGFSRWFNDDSIKGLNKLYKTLLRTAVSPEESRQIETSIAALTPGESVRRPRSESSVTYDGSDSESRDLDAWLLAVRAGEEILPLDAIKVLKQAQTSRPREFDAISYQILSSIGVGREYPTTWRWYDTRSDEALLQIAQIVREDALWHLVDSALRGAGTQSTWARAVSQNLQYVLMGRSAAQGIAALKSDLEEIIQMHSYVARGGRNDLLLPTVTLETGPVVGSWADLAAEALTLLLSSRSSEVVGSALIGLQALVAHQPSMISKILGLCEGDAWKRKWILNAAELWSTLYPEELERSRSYLETILTNGLLRDRIQSWVVLSNLAFRRQQPPPAFPNPPATPLSEQPVLFEVGEILRSPENRQGSFNFVNRFQSVESTIVRITEVTGANLETVRARIGDQLLNLTEEEDSDMHWATRIRCSGDTAMSGLESDDLLDAAIDAELGLSPLPATLAVPFAQAYLGSEDPWILRHSPLPDSGSEMWPDDFALRDNLRSNRNNPSVREKLYLLASRHRVPDDEVVVAARVNLFTWSDDIVFRLWHQQDSDSAQVVVTSHCPLTLSGRTFVFKFGNWWQPSRSLRPAVFAVGGQQRLLFSFPEFFPSRIWATEFGWDSSASNPLRWFSAGTPVARHERLHGAPRSPNSGQPRQPMVDRWLVKRDAWTRISEEHGPFVMKDDFQMYASNVES